MIKETQHKVLGLRELASGSFVLRLERASLDFEPGQYIHLGPLPGIDRREYSLYSSPKDDYLEVLVKVIPEGKISPRLHHLKCGDSVGVEGPFGFFRLEENSRRYPLLFLATGTGISPFHCFVRSYPDLGYRLIHGIRSPQESYDYQEYDPQKVWRCVSREKGGDYAGRISSWLKENPVAPDTFAYLCGNCDMIYEIYDILGNQGLPADRIHAEVYF